MVGELDVFEWRGWLVDGEGERGGDKWLISISCEFRSKWISLGEGLQLILFPVEFL